MCQKANENIIGLPVSNFDAKNTLILCITDDLLHIEHIMDVVIWKNILGTHFYAHFKKVRDVELGIHIIGPYNSEWNKKLKIKICSN